MPNYTGVAVTTVLVAVGSAEAKRITEHKGMDMSPVMGGFILGIFLFAFGIASENLATKFCVLIIVASLLVNGNALFKVFTAGPVNKIPSPITH